MKIVIGCDSVGLKLKDAIFNYLKEKGYDVTDVGVKEESDKTFYADIAEEVALKVKSKEFDRGLLFCGTGIGMAISANKIPGINATVCHDPFSAQRAQLSNNAKIITMGYRVIGPELAKVVLQNWLDCEFEEGSKSQSNVDQVTKLEEKYFK